jgi:hypothetical protein
MNETLIVKFYENMMRRAAFYRAIEKITKCG